MERPQLPRLVHAHEDRSAGDRRCHEVAWPPQSPDMCHILRAQPTTLTKFLWTPQPCINNNTRVMRPSTKGCSCCHVRAAAAVRRGADVTWCGARHLPRLAEHGALLESGHVLARVPARRRTAGLQTQWSVLMIWFRPPCSECICHWCAAGLMRTSAVSALSGVHHRLHAVIRNDACRSCSSGKRSGERGLPPQCACQRWAKAQGLNRMPLPSALLPASPGSASSDSARYCTP